MEKKRGAPENLDPVRTKEEAKRRGRNGGIKSGETRRAKRDARQAAQKLLDMAAKGAMRENLLNIGYSKNDSEGLKNIDVLVARLFIQAASGNLQAASNLLKIAGYDSEENRLERESINADRRKERESAARIMAVESGTMSRYSTTCTEIDGDEAVEDVFVYLPDNGRDADLQKMMTGGADREESEMSTELNSEKPHD